MMILSKTSPLVGVALAAVAAMFGTAVLSSPVSEERKPAVTATAQPGVKVAQNSQTRSFLPQIIVPKTTATRPEPARGRIDTAPKQRPQADAAAARTSKAKNRFKGHFYQIGVFW